MVISHLVRILKNYLETFLFSIFLAIIRASPKITLQLIYKHFNIFQVESEKCIFSFSGLTLFYDKKHFRQCFYAQFPNLQGL